MRNIFGKVPQRPGAPRNAARIWIWWRTCTLHIGRVDAGITIHHREG